MKDSQAKRVLEVVNPLLQDGERVAAVARAAVGSSPVKRQLKTAAAVGILTGGTVMAFSVPKSFYLVLTDRRLLFFEAHQTTGRPLRELAAELARAGLKTVPVKRSIYKSYDLTDANGTPIARLNFTLIDRRGGERLVAELESRRPGSHGLH
jgi:hypothetical protein